MKETLNTVEIVEVFDRKVWIESDFLGAKHVMIQHEDGESEPFEYCTFNYDHRYTSNTGVLAAAERVAVSLGATKPVEQRHRSIETAVSTAVITHQPKGGMCAVCTKQNDDCSGLNFKEMKPISKPDEGGITTVACSEFNREQ